MKVVLVNYRYFVSSGAEVFLFKCKRMLEAHGHTVIPFSTENSLNEPTPYARYFARARSGEGDVYFKNIKRTPKNLMRMAAGAIYNRDAEKKLRALLRDEKPDVMLVLQQMNALSPSVFAAARKERVPSVHRLSDFNLICPRYDCLRDGAPCTACVKGRYREAIKSRCVKGSLAATLVRCLAMKLHNGLGMYRSIARFIVPAAFTKELLCQSGIARERICQIPTFIDSSAITPAYENDGYILFLGRLSPEKGVDDLVDALALMKASGARLILTGDALAGYEESLRHKAEKLGVADRITFTGFVRGERLTRLIDGALCVALPAVWYENMPNAILEAYAHGKPVVVSNIGSMPEMVEENETGLLCEPGDPESLAEKLDALYARPSLAADMGRKGRLRCERLYAPESYYQRLMDVFDQAIRLQKEGGAS